MLVSQTSIRGRTISGVAKGWLFTQVNFVPAQNPYRIGLSVETSER